MQEAEADRVGDSQRSDQLTAPFRDLRGRFRYFAEDAFCVLQEGATVFSQHQLTRGTMYQGRADVALEFGQTLAGNRFRNLQAPCRVADRTGFRSRNEGEQGIQLQHRSVFPDTRSFSCSLDRTQVQ